MAFISNKKYEPSKDQVWVKRMILCAWAYSIKRRTKDYVTIFTEIKDEAAALGLIIDPKVIITDFELAALLRFVKTNNGNEGNNNNKIKLNCGAANPSMEKSTKLHRQYETTEKYVQQLDDTFDYAIFAMYLVLLKVV